MESKIIGTWPLHLMVCRAGSNLYLRFGDGSVSGDTLRTNWIDYAVHISDEAELQKLIDFLIESKEMLFR